MAAPTQRPILQQQAWVQILNLLSSRTFYFKSEHWPAFSALIDWHHILLDVYATLTTQANCHDFSPEQMAQLQAQSLAERKHLLMLTQLQKQVATALNSANIRALFFKGAIAGEWLYSSTIVRQCKDIDLIVHPDDHTRACATLEDFDYFRLIPRADISTAGLKRYQRAMKDHSYVHRQSGGLIELHWALRPFKQAFEFDFNQAWEQRRDIQIDGQPIPTFDNNQHIRYLAAHGCNSHWGRLRWLLDWQRIAKQEIDWQSLINDCANECEHSHIKNAFLLAHRQLKIVIPETVQRLPTPMGSNYCVNNQIKAQAQAHYPSWINRQLLNLLCQQNISGMYGYVRYMVNKGMAADTLSPPLPNHKNIF